MDGPDLMLLVCRAGAQACGIPVASVAEICRPLRTEPVAGAPDGVLGVATLRGRATPVLDLGWLLDGRPLAGPRRWIRLRVGDRAVAIAVDSVAGLRAVPRRDLEALPPLLPAGSGRDAYARLDRELLAVLDAARLVPPGLWRALDAGGIAA